MWPVFQYWILNHIFSFSILFPFSIYTFLPSTTRTNI
jgi:hypothetical protein